MTADDSKEAKLCSEDGSCVNDLRVRKPVPSVAASGLSLSRGDGKLRRE